MGTLKVDTIQDSGGNTILSSDGSGGFSNSLPAGKTSSFRNFIINGDMSVAQRGTSETGITVSQYPDAPDRFHVNISSSGTWTISQSTDVPTGEGFATSSKFDCTTANASPGSNDFLMYRTKLEAQNLQNLKYGTSNAESLTLSFWVKSNKTGTYNVWFYTEDTGKSTSAQYTISSASTWEKKTITISGTNSGTINNDNGEGMRVNFMLAAGTDWTSGSTPSSWESDTKANRAPSQVNLADSTSNEWYITGVQLEVGTTASDFEFLPHDVNLDRCFRYFQAHGFTTNSASAIVPYAFAANSTEVFGQLSLIKEMRASPSITQKNNLYWRSNTGSQQMGSISSSGGNEKGIHFSFGSLSVTAGAVGYLRDNAGVGNVGLHIDAEL